MSPPYAIVMITLALGLAWPFPRAFADSGVGDTPDQESPRTYLIRQHGGVVIERLRAAQENMSGTTTDWGPGGLAWWRVPRAMTALGALPEVRRDAGQALAEWVEPDLVRNWAEFANPGLGSHWQALAEGGGFSNAMLWLPAAGIGQAHPLVRWPLKRDEGLKNTWRNVVSEGARHDLTGQQALREWLTLPMPTPHTNPWLTNISGYRY